MTRRSLATALATTTAAAALVGAGGLAAAVPASAAPSAPYTALSIRPPLTGDLAGAITYDTIDDVSGIAATPLEGGGILMAANSGGAFAHVTITPPTGGALTAGQTLQISSAPTVTNAAVSIETTGTGCDYTGGTVSIPELVGDATAITVLAADVTGSCGTVQARVAADTAWSGLRVPNRSDFGDAALATYAERDVVVAVKGTSAVTFGTAVVTVPTNQDDIEEFGVMEDGCTGRTVVPDSTCTVTVGFSPWYAGERNGVLTVPDTTAPGGTRVELLGTGRTDSKGTYSGFAKPKRLIDTRKVGTKSPLAGGSTTRLQVAGAVGVPASGVSAVVLNLTAVDTTHEGYFTLYPNGKARPTASSINFPKGWTGANMVTVPVGADGKVALFNYGGPAHAVVDVLGWYWKDTDKPLGSQFMPLGDAVRIYDSRDEGDPLRGGDYVDLDALFGEAADVATVSQLVVNVTAVGATRDGVLTAWSGTGTRPTTSTVNYEPKVIAPNMAVVTAGHTSESAGFRISNTTSGSVHVVVDLVGVQFADSPFGLRFTPAATPTRLVDSRLGLGLGTPLLERQTRTVNASPVSSVDTWGIVTNTTGIKPTKQTYLTTWAGDPGSSRPDSSVLNVNPGVIRSASTYVLTTDTHRFKLFNYAGTMNVVMDVAGTLDFYPSEASMGPLATAAPATTADAGEFPTVRTFGGHAVRPQVRVEGGRVAVIRR